MSLIYLDNCATTPCKRVIADEMMRYFDEEYGNPSSLHTMGKRSRHAINQAQQKVAHFIGASTDEIIFTSGATESNNLALFGAFDVHEAAPVNAIFCPTDHKSSLDVAKELHRRGIDVNYVDVKRNGRLCIDSLKRSLNEHTRIVSVAYVNSEIGTIQDIEEIARVCSEYDTLFHVDAVQGAGKIKINVHDLGVGMLSISAHKIHGPKGIGALYIRSDLLHRLRPLIFGGGQNKLRSGTLPTPLIVGLGMACELAEQDMAANYQLTTEIRDYMVEQLHAWNDEFKLNTDVAVSIPHILNIEFPNVSSEALVSGLRKVAISSGSACNSDSLEPSYVLTQIGLGKEQANSSVRICLHSGLTKADIDTAVTEIMNKIHSIRCVSTM